ncbi:hypothetical protein IRJ41_017928, partial [Triplophysa rosa]
VRCRPPDTCSTLIRDNALKEGLPVVGTSASSSPVWGRRDLDKPKEKRSEAVLLSDPEGGRKRQPNISSAEHTGVEPWLDNRWNFLIFHRAQCEYHFW